MTLFATWNEASLYCKICIDLSVLNDVIYSFLNHMRIWQALANEKLCAMGKQFLESFILLNHSLLAYHITKSDLSIIHLWINSPIFHLKQIFVILTFLWNTSWWKLQNCVDSNWLESRNTSKDGKNMF